MKRSIRLSLALPLLLSISLNGASGASPRIVNGSTVSEENGEWRFIASLQWNGKHYCGASFVAPHWLVTAAHCLTDQYGDVYTPQPGDSVAAGSYDLDHIQRYGVKRFIVHPGFSTWTMDNDIALVEIDREAENVDFIDYHIEANIPVGAPTKAAGWGLEHETDTTSPTLLKDALLPIVDYNRCNQAYEGELTDNMICAGYFDAVRDSCQGDSGGPLKLDNRLVGIVSWGDGCAKEGYPGVYTNVQHYQGWISQYVPPKVWVPVSIGDLMTVVPVFLSDTP